MREYLTQRFELDIQGQKFQAFDIETSATVPMLNETFEKQDPLLGVENPKCILDVGANVGMVSFLAAKRFPNCQVYAVEPHPRNLKNLLTGIERNELNNVHVIPVAVGMRSKFQTLSMEHGNSGSASPFPHNLVLFPEDWPKLSAKVFTVRLDEIVEALVREHGGVDFMKVDIEGGEFDTLGSFTSWDCINRLHVELHPFCNPMKKSDAKRACEEFHGFLSHYMKGKPVTISQPNWETDDFRMALPE